VGSVLRKSYSGIDNKATIFLGFHHFSLAPRMLLFGFPGFAGLQVFLFPHFGVFLLRPIHRSDAVKRTKMHEMCANGAR
jgi:hypothetical protein